MTIRQPIFIACILASIGCGINEPVDCSEVSYVNPEISGCDYTFEMFDCHIEKEEYLGALVNALGILKSCDSSSTTLTNISNCHYKLKQFEEAEEFARRAIEVDPSNNTARYNLSVCLMDREESSEAVRIIESGPSIERQVDYCFLAFEAYWDIDNKQKARHFVERAIELDRENIGYKSRYAALLMSFEDYGTALAVATPLLNQVPDTSYFHYSIIDLNTRIRLHLDMYDEACDLNEQLRQRVEFREDYEFNLQFCE